jgi:hypothetical protein
MNKPHIFHRIFILVLFLFQLNVYGQVKDLTPINKINPRLLSDHWKASWITHPTESVLDYNVFLFRKSFTVQDPSGEFIINISADNRYRLFVNGTPVCFGPARGDLGHWFFESIDIAPFLQKGNNLIAAIVWNAGEMKPWAQFSIKTGLIVQGNSEKEQILNTDKSWKVIKNTAYSPASAGANETSGQFVVVGPCDRVNGELYPWGWEKQGYDDSGWLTPRLLDVGHPYGVGTDVNWVLTPRRIPLLEVTDQQFGEVRKTENCTVPAGFLQGKEKLLIPAKAKAVILLDQKVLTVGYPEILTSGGKGATVKVSYAESMFDKAGQKGNRNEIEGKKFIGYSDFFMPDGGKGRLFRPLWFRTWRYVLMEIETGSEALSIDKLSSQFSAYPLVQRASFSSDNELLGKIWDIGWRTARLCANETYYDCPYYEQLQYVGDTRIQALISMSVSGDDRLVRNALMQYNESRIYEGITYSRYPSSLSQFIPPFSLYWVDMVHDYYMMRDDKEFVKQFLPGIGNVLEWFTKRIGNDDMLGKVPYWNFVDWAVEWPWINENRIGGVPAGGMEGGSSILTMQLAYSLDRAAELYNSYGQKAEAEKYSSISVRLKKAVYNTCWDQSRGYLADTKDKKEFSMHAQIFAVLTNTIPENQQRAFTEKFMNDKSLIQPTMYFRAYLSEALKKTGLSDKYVGTLGLLEDMIAKGLTTFAENPDPARSDCHAWSASPNYSMLSLVAGIAPAEPGFKSVSIKPAFGSMTFMKGSYPHPQGNILFDLRKNGNSVIGTVILPEGLTGTFFWLDKSIPLKGTTKISM